MPVDWKAHMRRIFERLGEDVTLRRAAGGAELTARGIFAEPYESILAGSGVGLASSLPRFSAMQDVLPEVVRGDVLVRAGAPYRITAVKPSEPGVVELELER